MQARAHLSVGIALHVCLSVCMCVFVCVCVYLHVSVYFVYVCGFVCLCVSVCESPQHHSLIIHDCETGIPSSIHQLIQQLKVSLSGCSFEP